jgi:hypothetical protein
MSQKSRAGDDLLIGADAIADYLGISIRTARGFITNKTLPVFKLSGRVCAKKSTIDALVAERESAGTREWLERRLSVACGPNEATERPHSTEKRSK